MLFCISNFLFSQELTLEQAEKLQNLPLKCLTQQYPNKLGQLLLNETEILAPQELHPSFYGCFDWHSAVHGHWSLVYLLANFSDLKNNKQAIEKLNQTITKDNILIEVEYFSKNHEKSFERTYGWAWLLKLQLVLNHSHFQEASVWAKNLQPLTDLIVQRYIDFLPKLTYPIRVGTHTNSAFGMSLALDYAVSSNNELLQKVITENAKRLYLEDCDCPLNWEPSGTDFLSPCLEECSLMARVLPEKEFLYWVKKFLKPILSPSFKWKVATVSDRTDGHLVHLDGLNFSRAWNFYFLANKYPKKLNHLIPLADEHLFYTLPKITDGNYEGEHWLASFALFAFEMKKNKK